VNPARPAPGTTLCRLEDVADPGAKSLYFEVWPAAFSGFVVRRGQDVWGYVDSCPHAALPLAAFEDRYLTREKDRILCARHGALFRIEDGYCTSGPCAGQRLQRWPVRVEDGRVLAA
jgi:nitrite reductase/ring-hydroxylating ferredoxin subunit